MKGDPKTGERIPLTYGSDPVAKRLFDQFRGELQEVYNSEGITDAVVVQLGSGTTGWSSAPGKTSVLGVIPARRSPGLPSSQKMPMPNPVSMPR